MPGNTCGLSDENLTSQDPGRKKLQSYLPPPSNPLVPLAPNESRHPKTRTSWSQGIKSPSPYTSSLSCRDSGSKGSTWCHLGCSGDRPHLTPSPWHLTSVFLTVPRITLLFRRTSPLRELKPCLHLIFTENGEDKKFSCSHVSRAPLMWKHKAVFGKSREDRPPPPAPQEGSSLHLCLNWLWVISSWCENTTFTNHTCLFNL